MIRAIIFDFDGLLVDTETHEYTAFADIYKEHGAELPLELWSRIIGSHSSDFSPFGYLEECIGRTVDRNELRVRHRSIFNERMKAEQLRPGVPGYLASAKELGLKIGLHPAQTANGWKDTCANSASTISLIACARRMT